MRTSESPPVIARPITTAASASAYPASSFRPPSQPSGLAASFSHGGAGLDRQFSAADGRGVLEFYDPRTESWFSFERAKWEYLNHVVKASATIAEASRRLGLHPRSLRRMLHKHPPRR
jgi:hypothetical protein